MPKQFRGLEKEFGTLIATIWGAWQHWRMATSKAPKDHVIAVIKAGLNAGPVVGGSLASLIGDYVPTSTERSIEKALKLLAEKLTVLEGRIDVEAVKAPEQ